MTRYLHKDYETASILDVTKVGTARYAEDPSTRVLMQSYAFDDEAPRVWLPHLDPFIPEEIEDAYNDDDVIIVAHNAPFEKAITKHVLGYDIPAERWLCTQSMAHTLTLPAKLEDLGRVLKIADEKDKEGKRLIRLFCQPNRQTKKNPQEWNDWDTHPEDWAQFVKYGLRDVVAERQAFQVMRRYLPHFMRDDHPRWCRAQRINERGVPLDLEVVEGARVVAAKAKKDLLQRLTDLTGVDNPNSGAQMLPWLRDRGYPYNNLRANRVKIALEFDKDKMTPEGYEALGVRVQAARTGVTKLDAMQRAVCKDGHLRGMFEFRGASRTGRYGGRIVQLQNLARPDKQVEDHIAGARELLRERNHRMVNVLFDSPIDVATSCIRSCIATELGTTLTVVDFAAIELAVLAWWAKAQFWLDVLRSDRDPYKSFGVHFLEKAYEEITKWERFICKPGTLGSGYRLGGGFLREDKNGDIVKTGLWGYAEAMGVPLTQKESARATEIFRSLSPEIVNLWYEIEEACKEVIRTQQPREICGGIIIDIRAPFLRIRLPSGRYLHYCRPKVEKRRVLGGMDEHGKPKYFDAINMTYEGVDQQTKKWSRQATHGGKLVENVVQAMALDILDFGMEKAEGAGFDIFLHVHDEIGTIRNLNDEAHNLDTLVKCVSQVPTWAKGLPLSAAGYESPFYKKD